MKRFLLTLAACLLRWRRRPFAKLSAASRQCGPACESGVQLVARIQTSSPFGSPCGRRRFEFAVDGLNREFALSMRAASRTPPSGYRTSRPSVIFDFQGAGTAYRYHDSSGAAAEVLPGTLMPPIPPASGAAGLTCGSARQGRDGPGQMRIRQFTGKTGDNVLFA